MAEKSAKPRASASLRSARRMRRTVGRARAVSAPTRTCSCAMVVPPQQSGSPCRCWSRRAAPPDYINTEREDLFAATPEDGNGPPAVGQGIAVRVRDVRYAEKGAGATLAPADDENQ